ncbi:MAG: ATP synthase F1 subunit gamma [Sumerlaeia bacterium]
MAKGIKELRSRVRSIKNTKKITRAMEMVSAAKLRRAQTEMQGAKPFQKKLELLLGRLSRSPKAQENQLFQSRASLDKPNLLLLITSDRGLCGAFNANIIKKAAKYLQQHPNCLVYFIGKKGRDHFQKRISADRIVGQYIDFQAKLDGDKSDSISKELLAHFENNTVRDIDIISAEFISTSTNRPQQARFLPLEASAFGLSEEDDESIDYILEPSPEAIFEALLPRYLRMRIYLAIAENLTCEHSSRMLAMNAATKNCNDLASKLTLEMNKARQAAITTELTEIVAGADALN